MIKIKNKIIIFLNLVFFCLRLFLIGLFFEHLLQSKSSLRSEWIHILSDLFSLLGNNFSINRDDNSLFILDTFVNSLSWVSKSSISSFDSFKTSWKNNEFINIFFKSLNISLKWFIGLICSSGINSDSNRSGIAFIDSNSLDFLKSESSSLSDLTRISLGWFMNQRSEFWKRSWESGRGFLLSLL